MNLSICDANAMMGFSDCEEAQAAYMKARERPELQPDPMGYKAELFADEVRTLVERVKPIIAARLDAEKAHDLLQFILKRHWHYRFQSARN